MECWRWDLAWTKDVSRTWPGEYARIGPFSFVPPTADPLPLYRNGSHLLAPTSTNLEKYGRKGDIFAGFHSDLNYLTIHGRSRYPGLHIWARNSVGPSSPASPTHLWLIRIIMQGKRIQVSMPPGHLLVQAGKQLEWVDFHPRHLSTSHSFILSFPDT